MNKKKFILVINIVIAYVLGNGLGLGIRVATSILSGQHGKPSFLSTGFIIYGAVIEFLLLVAFLLLGNLIPVRGRIMKGLIFILLFWGSAYLPQLLGMMGGHSANVSSEAMKMSTVLMDSVGYLVKGICYGALLGHKEKPVKADCSGRNLFLSCLVSMSLFPACLAVFEIVGGLLWPKIYCINAFQIDRADTVSFYVVFYFFQVISGLIFPIFYRWTEYNAGKKAFHFICILAVFLWLPIVLILIFFGVEATVTITWGIGMVAAVLIDGAVFTGMLNRGAGS